MAVKIIRSEATNAYKGYRPQWYGVYRDGGKVTTFPLGVPLRGNPPPSGYVGDTGDEAFEASRAKAEAKFSQLREKGREKGEAVREVKAVIKMKTGRKFEDPALATLADRYLANLGERSTCHVAMVRSGFTKFAAYAAQPTAEGVKRAATLLEVTPELATAFFRHIAPTFAFSTVKRWSNLLTAAFDRLAPVGLANPFKGARLAAVGRAATRRDAETGEKVRVETVVHHRPIDRAQLRRLYAEAEKTDTMLHALAVTAASTGLRISDCCTLLWRDIHLTGDRPFVMVETTRKTGAKIAVPIFDYAPASPDYEPDLGEFRRTLETALAESADGEKYVFPEAARLYLTETKDAEGRVRYPGRDIIYSRGKALFARALFADEPTEADLAEDKAQPAPTEAEILAAIDAAKWSEARKARVRDIFTRHAQGETYRQIQSATGCAKSTISTDLAAVEALTGAKVKTREPKGASLRELLTKTRQERNAGRRGASLYSWHSLRGSFVVMMKDNGVPLDTVRLLVGHTATDMTLEYYNPTQRQAAETARNILTQRNRPQALAEAAETRHATPALPPPPPTANAPRPDLAALREALALLTPDQRAQLLGDNAPTPAPKSPKPAN